MFIGTLVTIYMIVAKFFDKAVELLLNLDLIESKLKATGVLDLISNYHSVMQLAGNEVR